MENKGFDTNDRELFDSARKIGTRVRIIYDTLISLRETEVYQQEEGYKAIDAAVSTIEKIQVEPAIRSIKDAAKQLANCLRPVLGFIQKTYNQIYKEEVNKIDRCITAITNIIQYYENNIVPNGMQIDSLGEEAWRATQSPDGTRRTKRRTGRS